MFLNGQIEVQTNESLLFLTVSLKNHNEINIHQVLKLLSFIHMYFLSTSIYDLVLINVCHFHQVLLQSLFKFDHYRDTRAFILDPCIQGIYFLTDSATIERNCLHQKRMNFLFNLFTKIKLFLSNCIAE